MTFRTRILGRLRRLLTPPPPRGFLQSPTVVTVVEPTTRVDIPIAHGRGELAQILHHHAPLGMPAPRMAFADITVGAREIQIAERVMQAFNRAMAEQAQQSRLPVRDVWETVAGAFHREFFEVLRAGNATDVATWLASSYRRSLTHGLGPGQDVFNAASTPDGNAAIATICTDRLVALAEALGVLPYENPEQGHWGRNLYVSADQLCAQITNVLGCSMVPNQAMGYFGIPIPGGLFFARAADHIYAAWRCRELGARKVAEIGGGLAGVGDFALRLGAESYAVYDLPIMNVIQGYSLLTAGHTVSLLGEPDGPVRVRPWWHFASAPDADVVVNQDSFPEIDGAFVVGYLKRISRISTFFLSMNQESEAAATADGRLQHVVGRLVAEAGGLQRISRAPYWIRKGYVEELYVSER
jgi:hypothetical protein